MSDFQIIAFGFSITLFCFFLMLLFEMRNNEAHILRLTMIKQIFQCKDWKWRLAVMEKVSYSKMVFQFWKPVRIESFYKTQHFLNPDSKIS